MAKDDKIKVIAHTTDQTKGIHVDMRKKPAVYTPASLRWSELSAAREEKDSQATDDISGNDRFDATNHAVEDRHKPYSLPFPPLHHNRIRCGHEMHASDRYDCPE